MKKITGLLIDVNNEKTSVATISASLHAYYELLSVDIIDIQVRKIGVYRGRKYAIICDDEGLLKSLPKISAIDNMGNPMFVGNLFIVRDGKNGEMDSLEQDDIDYLKRFIHMQGTMRYPKPYPMLHQVEYV